MRQFEEKRDLQYVRDCIDNEGFEYAFINYSDYKDVLDPIFHQLREAYVKAYNELEKYVGERTRGESDS